MIVLPLAHVRSLPTDCGNPKDVVTSPERSTVAELISRGLRYSGAPQVQNSRSVALLGIRNEWRLDRPTGWVLGRPDTPSSPGQPRSGKRAFVSRCSTLLLLVLLTGIMSSCSDPEPEGLAGMVRTPPATVGGVMLPDATNDGATFATKAEPGQLLVVYFGYTSCPDICPTTLADLRSAVADLDDEGDRIDVAFITVDPGRDTAENVTAYVRAFFPDGIALRTDDDLALREAAAAYGAAYEVGTTETGEVEVAHSAFLYAVDADGVIRVQWPFGMESEHITNDLTYLLNQMS